MKRNTYLHPRALQAAAFVVALIIATNHHLRALFAIPSGCFLSTLNIPVTLDAATKTLELLEHLRGSGELAAPSADHWGRLLKAVQVRLNAGYDIGAADIDFLVTSSPTPAKDGRASLPGHRRLVQGLRRFLVPTTQLRTSQSGTACVPASAPAVVTPALSAPLSTAPGLVDLTELPDTSANDVSLMDADFSLFDYGQVEDLGEAGPCLKSAPVAAGDQLPVPAANIIFDDEDIFPSGSPKVGFSQTQRFPHYLLEDAECFDPEL